MGVLKNELSWSKTRAQTFEECRRKYWFSYYGHWGGWEPNAHERTHALWVLKKLQTRWMWAGDVVHRAVADTLETLRAGGKREAEETAERTVALMRTEFDQSRKKKYWVHPKRYCGLVEHEYDEDVSDDEWGRVADHVRACIRAFFASPFPERLTALETGAWLPIERLAHFLLEGVKIYVKPDFAYREVDGAVIIDWKTGRRDEGGDPVQLACYTLFALDKGWAAAPSRIVTIEYNLARSDSREEVMNADRLEEVRRRILAGLDEMRPLHEAPEAEFPVAENERVCGGCPFRKVCTERPT